MAYAGNGLARQMCLIPGVSLLECRSNLRDACAALVTEAAGSNYSLPLPSTNKTPNAPSRVNSVAMITVRVGLSQQRPASGP